MEQQKQISIDTLETAINKVLRSLANDFSIVCDKLREQGAEIIKLKEQLETNTKPEKESK